MATTTLTFGDCAENHRGMQLLGERAEEGFSIEDLESAMEGCQSLGLTCELIDLRELLDDGARLEAEEAHLLVIRKAVDAMVDIDVLVEEQKALVKDTKAFMYGRVVNKKARHNLCFGETAQEPDYEVGKGTVVAFEDVPELEKLRACLPEWIGPKAENLLCEGNYYYNVKKCYIGFHGDSERKRVVAVRLGASLPLHYQWFQCSKHVGRRLEITLNHGDVYVMSEKAVGWDWKLKKTMTLRHAAGFAEVLKL